MKNVFLFSVRDTTQITSDFVDKQTLAKKKGVGIGQAVLGDTIKILFKKEINKSSKTIGK
jgi:hypothetical protein